MKKDRNVLCGMTVSPQTETDDLYNVTYLLATSRHVTESPMVLTGNNHIHINLYHVAGNHISDMRQLLFQFEEFLKYHEIIRPENRSEDSDANGSIVFRFMDLTEDEALSVRSAFLAMINRLDFLHINTVRSEYPKASEISDLTQYVPFLGFEGIPPVTVKT